MKTLTQQMQRAITPDQAIELLKKGNKRFVDNLSYNRNLLQQVNETAQGQYPFATILSCIDSRTTAELIFDQGLGDIFSIRIAGNVINDDILGSMEFACEIAGSKLIVVLGHTSCGAIKGACEQVKMLHLTQLLNKIQPAIDQASDNASDDLNSPEFIDEVAKNNVLHSMNIILKESEVLRDLNKKNKIKIIGGLYNISTGDVAFFE